MVRSHRSRGQCLIRGSSRPFHVKAGRLRALAVTPGKRAPALPQIPTLSEAGVDVVVVNWYGLIAPAVTPKAVLNRISSETAKAMHLPDVKKRLVAEGSEAVGNSPREFADHTIPEFAFFISLVINSA